MTPNVILSLVGGIIIAGFIGDLIFKGTKIPSVVMLMAIGLLIGPVLQIVDGAAMQDVAPLVGKIALLIILFAGGLSLDLKTVVSQLGKAVVLAVIAFALTFAIVMVIALFLMELGMIQSIILGTLLAGTASSIVIPVLSGLSVSNTVKTLVSIESALSNLFILVIVVLACDLSIGGDLSIAGVVGSFLLKILVSVLAAIVAGVLWARLIAALKAAALSYMLTLGFIFLLNYVVDVAGGSGPISILFFAVILANVAPIASRIAPRVRKSLGIRVSGADYMLNEFLHNISKELSFLAGTFFFVYLGVLVSFDDFTPDMIVTLGLLIGAIIVGRFLSLQLFRIISPGKWRLSETLIVLAMMPRGLATAVMAFKPMEAQYAEAIPGTDKFPFYAMIGILGSNLIMTAFVAWGEARLKREKGKEDGVSEAEIAVEEAESAAESTVEMSAERTVEHVSEETLLAPESLDADTEALSPEAAALRAIDAELDEQVHLTFTERLFQWMRIHPDRMIVMDKRSVQALKITNVVFWVMMWATATFATLGIHMGRPEIVLAAMLFSPLTELLHTQGLAIITGDIYIFLKSSFKSLLYVIFVVGIAAFISWAVPLTGSVELGQDVTNSNVLDYALSLFTGLLLPFVLLRGRRLEILAITPFIALMLVTPLVAVGYGLTSGAISAYLVPGLLAFASHLTAMLLGMIATQYVLGLTKHPASDFIREWKEQEVEHGALHKWFERLHLVQFLEYVGNFYARLAVLALLAVALYVPLQVTISKLSKEYDIKQTVQTLARETFEQGQRSGIWQINTEDRDGIVHAHIQIHTNQYYPAAEQKAFENKVEKQLARPFLLRLDQIRTGAEIGRNDPLALTSADIHADIDRVQVELFSLEHQIPGMAAIDMRIIGFRTEFRGAGDPRVVVEVIKDGDLSPDSETLLRNRTGLLLGMSPDKISFHKFPVLYLSDSLQLEQFRAPGSDIDPVLLLGSHPRLKATLYLPAALPTDSLSAMTAYIKARHPLLADTARAKITLAPVNRYELRLR